jgi:hypothetical protein
MEQSLRSWGDRWNEPITRSGQYRVSWSTTARSHRASSFPLACRSTASRSYYHFAGLRAADATVRDQEVANILYSSRKTQGYLRRRQKKKNESTRRFLKIRHEMGQHFGGVHESKRAGKQRKKCMHV